MDLQSIVFILNFECVRSSFKRCPYSYKDSLTQWERKQTAVESFLVLKAGVSTCTLYNIQYLKNEIQNGRSALFEIEPAGSTRPVGYNTAP